MGDACGAFFGNEHSSLSRCGKGLGEADRNSQKSVPRLIFLLYIKSTYTAFENLVPEDAHLSRVAHCLLRSRDEQDGEGLVGAAALALKRIRSSAEEACLVQRRVFVHLEELAAGAVGGSPGKVNRASPV